VNDKGNLEGREKETEGQESLKSFLKRIKIEGRNRSRVGGDGSEKMKS